MDNRKYEKIDPSGILDNVKDGPKDEIDGPVAPRPYLWPNSGHSIKLGTTSGLFLRVRNKSKGGLQCVDCNGPSTGLKSNKALFKLFHDRSFPSGAQRDEHQQRPPSDVLNIMLGVPGERVNKKYTGKIFMLRTLQVAGNKTLCAEEFEDGDISHLIEQIRPQDKMKYRFQLEYHALHEAFYLHDYDEWQYENKTHFHYVFWHKDGSVSRRKKLPQQLEPNPNLRFLMKNYHDESDVTDFA